MLKQMALMGLKSLGLAAILAAAHTSAHAADKVTYEEHVLPIFRNACLKCHNPNENKGDLDLTSFSGLLKGGGSGSAANSGDPEGSKMIKLLTHSEEPFMPPNSPKIADKDIDTIKKWIAGGMLETSGSKALASNKPKVDLSAGNVAIGKPDGPPPMPQDLLIEPTVHTTRTSASTGLAGSPWSPLVALGAPKQILIYNTDTLELSGVLPFPEGYPCDVKFSRNGKLVLCGGGYGAKAGMVVVWDVTTGDRILSVGDEFDSVLAADISPDQKWIALGGPSRLVSIFSTSSGEREHQMKKHTDWVTAMEFSPDGKYLATGDRNGGVVVWESATGGEIYTLNGHKAAITSISWRGSDLVGSASEDGTVKLWSMKDGTQARSMNAHNNGVLGARYTHDGRLVTCGRDNQISMWDTSGSKQRSVQFTNQLPVRAVFNYDGSRIIATDFAGDVAVWNSADGKLLGALSLNPPSLAARIELAEKRVEELNGALEKANLAVTAAEAELMQAESLQSDAKKVDAAKEKLRLAKLEVDQANASITKERARIVELKAAQFNVGVYQAKDELAKKRREHDKLVAGISEAENDAVKATNDLAAAKKALTRIPDSLDGWKNVLRFDRGYAAEADAALKAEQKKLAKVEASLKKATDDEAKAKAAAEKKAGDDKLAAVVTGKHQSVESLQKELEAAKKAVEEKQAVATAKAAELAKTTKELSQTEAQYADMQKKIKTLTEAVKGSAGKIAAAKAAVEKSKRTLDTEQARVQQLAEEFKRLKASATPPKAG